MSAQEQIVTQRLILRHWRARDIGPLAQLNANPEVMRYFPRTYTFEETAARVAAWSQGFLTRLYSPWAFDHPELASGHPLRRHVVYRLAREAALAADSGS